MGDPMFKGVEETGGNRYEVYAATSEAQALEFLRRQEIRTERRYVVVATPQGNFGKDLISIFNEASQKTIEFGERKPLPELEASSSRCTRCGYSVIPAGLRDGITVDAGLERLKQGGLGFECAVCNTLWCPFCVEATGATMSCGLCNGSLGIHGSAGPPVGDPLERCGACTAQPPGLELVRDQKNNRGYLCGSCASEYGSRLEPGSAGNFWMCGACNYRLLAGTPADIMVDDNHNRCPNCGADVNCSLVNLSGDEPVGSDSIIGAPLEP